MILVRLSECIYYYFHFPMLEGLFQTLSFGLFK